VVGLSPEQIAFLSEAESVAKVSRADLAAVLASGMPGATTVAGTMIAADMAGIRILATGGIGGVHRGGENSMDISADLTELGRTPVAVVCSGAKAILDLARTLEVLETFGVPVVGYATKEFPAFYSRESGLQLVHRVETPEEAAKVMKVQCGSGKRGANEVNKNGHRVCQSGTQGKRPSARWKIDAFIAAALRTAETAGVRGKDVHALLAARSGKIERRENVEGEHRASCCERRFGEPNCRFVLCSGLEKRTLAKFPPFIPPFYGHPAS